MSYFSSLLQLGSIAAGKLIKGAAGGWVSFALLVASYFLDGTRRTGGTPPAAEQGTQREMVPDPQANIPVVYGRAIVAPRLAYVTTTGQTLEKLYLVCVLSEGNCAVTALGAT